MTSDQELLCRARNGDVEAFAGLAERYERSVWGIVQADVRDPVLAEKITLRTLKRAYCRLSRLPEGASFGTWLLQIARRQTFGVLCSMPTPVISQRRIGADDAYDWNSPEWIQNEHVLGLIVRLPREERRVVGLRYFDNHDLGEIAELVNQPVSRVSRRLSRALTRLQNWWEWEQE